MIVHRVYKQRGKWHWICLCGKDFDTFIDANMHASDHNHLERLAVATRGHGEMCPCDNCKEIRSL